MFDKSLEIDREKVDLLLVIGTSLKVSPVADLICMWRILSRSVLPLLMIIPSAHIPHSVPQVSPTYSASRIFDSPALDTHKQNAH